MIDVTHLNRRVISMSVAMGRNYMLVGVGAKGKDAVLVTGKYGGKTYFEIPLPLFECEIGDLIVPVRMVKGSSIVLSAEPAEALTADGVQIALQMFPEDGAE